MDKDPWWFCSDGLCRFDLTGLRGTCYLAEDALGAFVEVFKDFGAVAESDVEARRIAELSVRREMHLADCTAAKARRFGITAEIHSSPDYAKTQRWAAALAAAGFDGVRYLARHDPSVRLVSYALFGPTGVGSASLVVSKPIGLRLLRRAADEFGIDVLPTP